MDFTAEEKFFIIERLIDYPLKSVIYVNHNGIFEKYIYAFCPYCGADNTATKGGSFLFECCIYCNKVFKLT